MVMAEPDGLTLRRAYDSRLANPAVDPEVELQERFLTYFRALRCGARVERVSDHASGS